jgi:hypothetical protein
LRFRKAESPFGIGGLFLTYTEASASSYSPTPNTSQAAVIISSGASAPAGNPGPDSSHGPHGVRRNPLAQFGQLFNNYNAGNFYYNGLCQNITVGTGGGAFTGYAWAQGDELRGYVEDMAADVTGTSAIGMTLSSILYMENVVSPSSSGDSAWRPITFTVPGGAQTLFIGMWTKSGESATSSAPPYSSYWWLDSLAIH